MKQFKTINQNKADIEIGYKEQKQHLIDIMKSDEDLGLYEELKEETPEEAIENRIKGINVNTGFKQERSYSEEDMIEFGKFIFKNTLLVNVKGVEGILEQFKKK
tara:strand:+ start:913 stop:1224 length:312 start_codon:yes stop_codon:yes gene_type:complete